MNAAQRWGLALPLILLSLLLAAPAVFGTATWWTLHGTGYRVLSVVICLVVAAQLAVAVSIGVRPTREVPWIRIGLVVFGILLTCGLARLRGQF